MTADRTSHLTAATRRRVTDTRDRATACGDRLSGDVGRRQDPVS